jgi:periplasmic divalent cation tolerance protein
MESAEEISQSLVDSKLAACCSILTGLTSIYRWEGKIEKQSEVQILIKSQEKCYKDIEKLIKKFHPYSVPEIIALPIQYGSEEYLKWVDKETGSCNG